MTAPTAEEVAAARTWLDDEQVNDLVRDGHLASAHHIRTLLAALDAAEARAETAEKERGDAEVFAQGSVRMVRERLETAERERDEARAALVAIQERRFPIMHGPSIRWSVLAPHEKQAMRNHSQTLAQLADRGGLDPIEAMAVYEDHEYPRGMCGDQATAMRAAWRALVDRTDAQAKEAPRG